MTEDEAKTKWCNGARPDRLLRPSGANHMTNSVTTYEVFPRLSDKPIQAFESRIDAVQYVTDRRHVVPGLRLFETVTTVARREIHTSHIEDELDARAFNRENCL
jgi:hypothetical protein